MLKTAGKSVLISVILALFALFVLSSCAAAAPGISARITGNGNSITVTLSIPGGKGIAGGNVFLAHDPLKYDIVSSDTINTINDNYQKDGKSGVKISFASATAFTEEFILGIITYNLKEGEFNISDFAIESHKLANENAEIISDLNKPEFINNYTP